MKVSALLLGIALLIGGGACSIGVLADTHYYAKMSPPVLLVVVVMSGLFFWKIKQAKYVILFIATLFLIGSGLCFSDAPSKGEEIIGLVLINIGLALAGYLLIRTIIKSWRKPSN